MLVLHQATIGRETRDGADGLDCKLTEEISPTGEVRLLSKKCYDSPEQADTDLKQFAKPPTG